jgi:hypothetical protein
MVIKHEVTSYFQRFSLYDPIHFLDIVYRLNIVKWDHFKATFPVLEIKKMPVDD